MIKFESVEEPKVAPKKENRFPKILGLSLQTWLIAAAVLLAIPLVNMVALPLILIVLAPVLLVVFWRLRRSY